jgi:hypothetical protein
MFHSNTEQLIDYWRDRRGAAAVAARASINPTDFAHLLPQVFMLGRRGPGQYHFRLAGGFIADLHGRDLREEDLIRIWAPEDRLQLQLALESARRRPDPLVIEALAQTDSGAALQLEIMLTPLAGQNGEIDRMMGFYQPTSPVAALMGQTVGRLKLMSIRAAADDGVGALPRLRLATVDGRQVA